MSRAKSSPLLCWENGNCISSSVEERFPYFAISWARRFRFRAYLHDLILQGVLEEVVDNLVLLDGERVQVDLLHAVDLASLYETAELGDGLPLLLLALAAAATTATTTATAFAATASETTATSTVSHFV